MLRMYMCLSVNFCFFPLKTRLLDSIVHPPRGDGHHCLCLCLCHRRHRSLLLLLSGKVLLSWKRESPAVQLRAENKIGPTETGSVNVEEEKENQVETFLHCLFIKKTQNFCLFDDGENILEEVFVLC